MNFLKIFRYITFTHVPKMQKSKLNKKIKKCILIGFDEYIKVYRMFDPLTHIIVISKDVICNETKIGFQHLTTTRAKQVNTIFLILEIDEKNMNKPNYCQPSKLNMLVLMNIIELDELSSNVDIKTKCNIELDDRSIHYRYSIKDRRSNIRLKNHVTYAIKYILELQYYKQAIRHKE